jgi:hypothetical protein
VTHPSVSLRELIDDRTGTTNVARSQGVIVTALSYYMQMWTIAKRGPVFLAMSMPLTFVFTIVISSFVIGDAVSLGRSVYTCCSVVVHIYR